MTSGSQVLPSVGVIVPNHDRLKELVEAVGSVCGQIYTGRVQIYVVYRPRPEFEPFQGCFSDSVRLVPSTDESGRNSIAVKRNLGLAETTEDLVAFLDDDDLWHPEKLAVQVEVFLKEEGLAAVGTRALYFDRTRIWRLSLSRRRRIRSRHRVVSGRSFGTSSILVDGPLARRLRFDERPEWLALEDYDFKIRLSENGEMCEVADRLTAYRYGTPSVYDHTQRETLLKAVGVLVASLESGISQLSKRFVGVRLLLISAIGGFGPGTGGHRMIDVESERALGVLLGGRLLGCGDRRREAFVRTGWRRGWRARLLRLLVRWPRLVARAVRRRLRSV